jgi:hypothetical protein
MKNDLITGAWQHDIGCPINIILFSTSDAVHVKVSINFLLEIPKATINGWGNILGIERV